MKSIPTVFLREQRGKKFLATPEVNPDAAWVLDGEGAPTIKYDGSACLVQMGNLYRRHKHNAGRGSPPPGWMHHSLSPDQQSGHGWLPTSDTSPADRYHIEAWAWWHEECDAIDGTYELVGPKLQSNPYKLDSHKLWQHGMRLQADPRTYESIESWLADSYQEGIVWHHPDGHMAKIKRRDFGIQWP